MEGGRLCHGVPHDRWALTDLNFLYEVDDDTFLIDPGTFCETKPIAVLRKLNSNQKPNH